MYGLKDAALTVTKTLPVGTNVATSGSIDLGLGALGELKVDAEFVLASPAVLVGALANAATLKFDILASASSDLSSPTVTHTTILTQTGAGGVGAGAATIRFKEPLNPGGTLFASLRYLGFRCTNSGTNDASAGSATLDLVV